MTVHLKEREGRERRREGRREGGEEGREEKVRRKKGKREGKGKGERNNQLLVTSVNQVTCNIKQLCYKYNYF